MKRFLLPILLITTQVLFCQISKKEQIEELRSNAKEIKMNKNSETPSLIVFRNDYNISNEKALEYSKSFCLSENTGFNLKNSHVSKDGKQFYRYEQTIDGYPIEFSAWHVHVKNGRVTTLNGDLVNVKDFVPVFSISEKEALQAALNHIGADLYMWEDKNGEQFLKYFMKNETATYYPTGIKVIAPGNSEFISDSQSAFRILPSALRSAYKFDIFSKFPFNRKMVYVDAQTGEILFDLPLIYFSDEIGTAHTQYSGIRDINTYFNGTNYTLLDFTRGIGIETLNCQNMATTDPVDFLDDDNVWNNVNAQLDEYATDAHFAAMSTYDYYYNVHNRNSIDNEGYPLVSFVHFNLKQMGYPNNVNAFWAGVMVYGDGDVNGSPKITPLTTMDICGHEISHGLTQYTANLIYAMEPGALNEAFSDILGTSIEFYAVPEYANWTIAEKIGVTFRSMKNPKLGSQPDTYKKTYWATDPNYDNGGVHINSGVLNYWYYLLCEGGIGVNDNGHSYQVAPIGMEKAEQIVFKLLTEYLTPTSQYYDTYLLGIHVANELFGNCSPETQSVGDAFYAVGVITEPYMNVAIPNFKASETDICSPYEIRFANKTLNGGSYLWDFGDGNTSTDINPAHTYADFGTYTVTLTTDDEFCGSGTEIKEDYITIDESIPCSFIMSINTHDQIEGCEGIIYDCGGPDGNYLDNANSILTIHAPGAEKIVLQIEEFDIESGDGNRCNYDYIKFHDGNSTSSPKINNRDYCNTFGNPGTISSTDDYITIHFKSDEGFNLEGYKISYQCVEGAIPEPEFSVNAETSCNGRVRFTDNTNRHPKTWAWDFGDGTTSNAQNPTHQYTENGTYTVTLTVSNYHGTETMKKDEYIIVEMPATPEIADIEACNNFTFDIEIDLEGTAYWYETITSANPKYKGNKWNNHPKVTENKTYYVREVFGTNSNDIGLFCASYFTEVKLIPTTCVSIFNNHIENIVITPNPTTGQLTIDNGELTIKSVEIVDATGIMVQIFDFIVQSSETRNIKPETSINISHLPAGIYFVKITTENGITTQKIVKK